MKVVFIFIMLLINYTTVWAGGESTTIKMIEGKDGVSFKGIDFDGNEFDLGKYYKNKPIILNFFSWQCVSCLTAASLLEKSKETYHIKDEIIFVYISLDEWKGSKKIHIPAVWEKVFSKNQIRISDGDRIIGKAYEVVTLPVTILIDKNGKINYRRDDYSLDFEAEINQKIKEILKK